MKARWSFLGVVGLVMSAGLLSTAVADHGHVFRDGMADSQSVLNFHSPGETEQESVVPQDTARALRSVTEQVVLDAIVETKKDGQLLGSLKPEDFQVFEDGVPQKITYFSHDTLPLSVVFLFDLTDTVRPVLRPLADGSLKVLEHLKPQDEAAVMVFYSTTQILQNFTTDHSLVVAAIQRASTMKSQEATFLNEDVYQAAEESRNASNAINRRVLVFLTDGTSNVPSAAMKRAYGQSAPARLHTESEAYVELFQSGTVVSALIERSALSNATIIAAYGNPSAPFVRTVEPPGAIRKYAKETGGVVLSPSSKEVTTRMADLLDRLRNRYTLGYSPSNSQPAGKFCSIQLKLSPDLYAREPELRPARVVVRTKRGYYR
jgi:VWFA-related protein